MPKQTQVKGFEEIAKIISKQLSLPITTLTPNAINTLDARPTFLAQELTEDVSNDKFTQKSINKNNIDEFDNPAIKKLFDLFFTDVEVNS